jgi:hypothetical protein
MQFQTLVRPRALTPDQATERVGELVTPLAPNLATASVIVDAASGEAVLAYLPLPDVSELRRAVVGMKIGVNDGIRNFERSSGTRTQSPTFGYSPRRPVYQRESCSLSTLSGHSPEVHATVMGYASQLSAVLAATAPGVVQQGREVMGEVGQDWKLGESEMWTSGVINSSAQLPYHRDAMNFPVWSAMPVLRRHMDGGYLAVPEYDLVIACRDGWGVFFPGYQLVHGVTPMAPRRPDGYRYSLVYYALRGMQSCFEWAVEQQHGRRARSQREQIIARKLRDGVPPPALTGVGLPPGRSAAYSRAQGKADGGTYEDVKRQIRERNASGGQS